MKRFTLTILLAALFLLLQTHLSLAQSADALIQRAEASIERGEYESAIKDLNEVLGLNLGNMKAFAQLARASAQLSRAYYLSKNVDEAFSYAEMAIKYNPKEVAALNIRGLVKRERKDLEGAIADFTQAISFDPKMYKAFYNRAEIYLTQNKSDLALADFNKVIEIEPKTAAAYVGRGIINKDRLKDGGKTSLADFTKAIELNPKLVNAYLYRAQVYYRLQKNNAAALADLNEAIKINPNNGYAFAERGFVNINLNNYAQAESDYTQALKLNYVNPNVYNNRGYIYKKLNKINLALDDYRQALRLDPNHQLAKKNLDNLLKEHPIPCPSVRVKSDESVSAGNPIKFTVDVNEGDSEVTPTFVWTVSAGTIFSGQGTSNITVDTTDLKEGTSVTATVDVGGYDRNCATSGSVTTLIKSKN